MAEQPQTTLSEVITSPTEEKKSETVTSSQPQEPPKEEKTSEPKKKIEATQENKDKSI